MSKKALIVIAEGFEEIEAVTVMDVLRRAGVEVTVSSIGKKDVTGAHGVTIKADAILSDKDQADAIVLPGGMPGASNLAASKPLTNLIKRMNEDGKIIAAICAAPAVVLTPAGILKGKKATCYPGFENQFSKDVTFSKDRVVVDDNVITSRGPGTALEFALTLTQHLVNSAQAQQLSEGMLSIGRETS